jgi:hypothetical protein
MERTQHLSDEAKREEAQETCCELILKLWERRTHWPHGQPLDRVAALLAQLVASQDAYAHSPSISGRPWTDALPKARRLMAREDSVWTEAALAEVSKEDIEKENEWVRTQGEHLSADETKIIEQLTSLTANLKGDYFKLDTVAAPNFGSMPVEQRSQIISEALGKINTERLELLALTKQRPGILPPTEN